MVRSLRMICLLIGQCVEAYLLHHGEQAVAAGGREVVFQSDAVDEVEVGRENVVGCLSIKYAQEQGHDAFHNECIALCLQVDVSVAQFGINPHAALAAVNQAGLSPGQ